MSPAVAMMHALAAVGELNGTAVANKAAVEAVAKGSSLIFLTKSEYQDLCYRANVADLARYKGLAIWVVSDPTPTE